MFVIREARPSDLDGLQDVARHLDSVNLPNDRERLRALIAASEASFAARAEVADCRFLFVLVDAGADERVLGTSMLFAQHGSRRAPHVYFDVLEEERYSATLDVHFVHRILRVGYNYKGLTEVGGLVLRPELRRHPEQLGRLLSYVRFAYIGLHRAIFCAEVLSELMPPLEPDGTSLLWEALGRRFTGLTYQAADRLSHENKEFIRALFPEEPIYATLLPPAVQAVIGQVGPETKGVEKMLRRIGFAYANRIDPFDGGPHFHARVDDVTLIRDLVRARVAIAPGEIAPDAGRFLVAVDGAPTSPGALPPSLPPPPSSSSPPSSLSPPPPPPPSFRAAASTGVLAAGMLTIPAATAAVLGLSPGAEVAALPLAT